VPECGSAEGASRAHESLLGGEAKEASEKVVRSREVGRQQRRRTDVSSLPVPLENGHTYFECGLKGAPCCATGGLRWEDFKWCHRTVTSRLAVRSN
jgi:hypothetical protein